MPLDQERLLKDLESKVRQLLNERRVVSQSVTAQATTSTASGDAISIDYGHLYQNSDTLSSVGTSPVAFVWDTGNPQVSSEK